jgi:hypothetical protein
MPTRRDIGENFSMVGKVWLPNPWNKKGPVPAMSTAIYTRLSGNWKLFSSGCRTRCLFCLMFRTGEFTVPV